MIFETIISSLVGLLGTGLTTYSQYKMEALKAENERKKLELETNLMIAEAEASIKVAQAQSQVKIEEAEASIYEASQAHQGSLMPSTWVETLLSQQGWARFLTVPVGVLLLTLLGIGDAIQHLMRSFLTLYSLGIASWVTYKSYEMLSAEAQRLSAPDAWKSASEVVMLLAVTMVTWWFGDRRVAKHLAHLKTGK